MRINTPMNIHAEFLMRGETLDDSLPRISPSQVHGQEIIRVDDSNASQYVLPSRPQADGILLMTSRVSASLRFADCAPVMLWGSGWAMILHSGFKGTVLNISGHGVSLAPESASEIHAWVGPCIGRREYERDAFEEWSLRGMSAFHRENYDVAGGKVYFDLAGEIRSQLMDCGVRDVKLSGINTFTNPECYSYRRGDKTERMMLYVRLM